MNSAIIISIITINVMMISIMTINCFIAELINLTKCAMICQTLSRIRIQRLSHTFQHIYFMALIQLD